MEIRGGRHRSVLDAVGPGVDVHRVAAQERHQRQSGLLASATASDDGADTAASNGMPAITAF